MTDYQDWMPEALRMANERAARWQERTRKARDEAERLHLALQQVVNLLGPGEVCGCDAHTCGLDEEARDALKAAKAAIAATSTDPIDLMLGINLDDPLDARARALINAHRKYVADLRNLRVYRNLTTAQVAERMDWPLAEVERLEQQGPVVFDVPLSMIRRYAMAVGARVTHGVYPDELAADEEE